MRQVSRKKYVDVKIYCLECYYESIITDAEITEYFSDGDSIFCPNCESNSIIATDGEILFKKGRFVQNM